MCISILPVSGSLLFERVHVARECHQKVRNLAQKGYRSYENPHKMSDGWIHLNEKPGLGLEISEAALKKFGKLVYKNK